MPEVKVMQATVYYAPTANRRFFTKKAAALAEARAMVMSKYPSEAPEYDDIGCTDQGFHWTSEPSLVRLRNRLARMIFKRTPTANPVQWKENENV